MSSFIHVSSPFSYQRLLASAGGLFVLKLFELMPSRSSCLALSCFKPVPVSNLSPRLSVVAGRPSTQSEVDVPWLCSKSNTVFLYLNFLLNICHMRPLKCRCNTNTVLTKDSVKFEGKVALVIHVTKWCLNIILHYFGIMNMLACNFF